MKKGRGAVKKKQSIRNILMRKHLTWKQLSDSLGEGDILPKMPTRHRSSGNYVQSDYKIGGNTRNTSLRQPEKKQKKNKLALFKWQARRTGKAAIETKLEKQKKSRHILLRKRLWLAIVIVAGMTLNFRDSEISSSIETLPLSPIQISSIPYDTPVVEQKDKVVLKIEQGSTFGGLIEPYSFQGTQIRKLLADKTADSWLGTRLIPGKEIIVEHNNWVIEKIEYPINPVSSMVALWDSEQNNFSVQVQKAEVITQPAFVRGTINSAFYSDAQKNGIPESLIVRIANIYQWDIDFVNDIRKGDEFKTLYLREIKGEVELRPTKILASQFTVRGETITAIAYEFSKEEVDRFKHLPSVYTGQTVYYTPEGKPLRKAFTRMPLSFGRVSSRYNPNRVHPLFGTKRPHRGTDYAAPRHTPILSVANGRVIRARWGTGYGRYVVIDHGNGITTLYAHLQKFKSGIKPGKRVKQGDVIGTVGTSGWATGPHVHYEFRVNGVHKNPETVKLPNAPSLPKELIGKFNQHRDKVMEMFFLFEKRSGSFQTGG